MFERKSKHRAEQPEGTRLWPILFLGATVTNALLFARLYNADDNIQEVTQAAEQVTTYLQDDGYENVRNLKIDYRDDSFSFIIYDSQHFLSCNGTYDYSNRIVRHIGNVTCDEIDFPTVGSDSTRLV